MVVKEDLLRYLGEVGEASWTEYKCAFVEVGFRGETCSRTTWIKYNQELMDEGKVSKIIDDDTRKPVYTLSGTGKVETSDIAVLRFITDMENLTVIDSLVNDDFIVSTLVDLPKDILQDKEKVEDFLRYKKVSESPTVGFFNKTARFIINNFRKKDWQRGALIYAWDNKKFNKVED